jgi:hypothetical protein
MVRPVHDTRREPVGGFTEPVAPDDLVGSYANRRRERRRGCGSFAGDACSLDGDQLFTTALGQAGNFDNQFTDVVPITGTVNLPTGGDITITCGGFATVADSMRVTALRVDGIN